MALTLEDVDALEASGQMSAGTAAGFRAQLGGGSPPVPTSLPDNPYDVSPQIPPPAYPGTSQPLPEGAVPAPVGGAALLPDVVSGGMAEPPSPSTIGVGQSPHIQEPAAVQGPPPPTEVDVPTTVVAAKPPTAYQYGMGQLSEREAAAGEIGQRKKEAIDSQLRAETEKNNAVSEELRASTEQVRQDRLASADRMRAANEEADRADNEARKRAADIANRKIDPEGRRSTGQKILGGIALALGTFGSALSKTPNYALQVIKDSIDRDVDAQKEEIANAKDSAKMLSDLSQKKYGRAMSLAEYESHQRLESLNLSRIKVEQIEKEHAGSIDAAKAEALKIGIDETKQAEMNAIANQRLSMLQQREAQQRAAANAAAAAAAASSAKNYENLRKEYEENSKRAQDRISEAEKDGRAPNPADEALINMGLPKYISARAMGAPIYKAGPTAAAESEEGIKYPAGATHEEKAKLREARNEAVGSMAQIETLKTKLNKIDAATRFNPIGSALNIEGSREAETDLGAAQVAVEEMAGAIWKIRTGGIEPKRQEMIEKIAAPFLPLRSDKAETKLYKLNAIQAELREAARSKGISLQTPEEKKQLATEALNKSVGFKP